MAHHTPLHQAAAEAVAALTPTPAADIKVEAPPKVEMGDLAVACFPFARALGRKPNEIASEIAAAFRPTGLLASASASGPFVNFRADRCATLTWLVDAALRDRLIPHALGAGKTIC